MLQSNLNTLQNLPRTIRLYTKNKKLEEFIVNNVISYCEKCGTKFNKGNVSLLSDETNVKLFIIKCHVCGHQQALVISLVDNSMAKTRVQLDIPLHSVKGLAKQGPISAKEVLKFHKALKKIKTVQDFLENM